MVINKSSNKYNRIAIFAHYDKNNIIQDYVIYYLKELKKVVDDIVFVSDSDINETELSKINIYTTKIIAHKHGEYDFGSYKRGFLYLKENNLLQNYDELIFLNDSCYAPIFPFEVMFEEMSAKQLDFWGVTSNHLQDMPNHIQSYFIVFKQHVFTSDIFQQFINSIQKQNDKNDIILKYEIGLTTLLSTFFQWDVYCQTSKIHSNAYVFNFSELILHDKSPFLKRNFVILKEQTFAYPFGVKKIINKYANYNYKLIENDKKNNGAKFSIVKFCLFIRKKIIKIHLKEKKVCLFGRWIT